VTHETLREWMGKVQRKAGLIGKGDVAAVPLIKRLCRSSLAQGLAAWMRPFVGRQSQGTTFELGILGPSKRWMKLKGERVGIEPDPTEIEERMHVGSEKQPVLDVIRFWTEIGKNVRGFQDLFDSAATHCAATPVRTEKRPPKVALSSSLNEARQDP